MSSPILLSGSERRPLHNSVSVGRPSPTEPIEITLVLRRKEAAPDPHRLSRHLTHEELASRHGAVKDDISAVERFATRHHLSIGRIDEVSRTVRLRGPLAAGGCRI